MRDEAFDLLKQKVPNCMFLLNSSSYLIRYEYVLILELIHAQLGTSFQQELQRVCFKELSCRNASASEPFFPLYCQEVAKLVFLGNNPPSSSEILQLLGHPLEEVRTVVMTQLNQENFTIDITNIRIQLEKEVSSDRNTQEYRSMALSILTRDANPAVDHYLPWALQLYQDSSSDVMLCTALEAFGNVIRFVETGSNIIQQVLEWSGYLLDGTQSTIQFRLTTVKLLNQNFIWLTSDGIRTNSKEYSTIVSNLWTSLFNCLMDDDESVRLAACAALGLITNEQKWKHVQPVVAIEAALDYFVNRIGCVYPTDVVLTLIRMVITNSEEQPESESQSFEKDETNSFLEPTPNSLLLCKYIQHCVEKNAISTSGISLIKEELDRCWQSVENFDLTQILDHNSIMSRRRFINMFILELLNLLRLTGSLQKVDKNIFVLYQRTCQLFKSLPPHAMAYSIEQFIAS